MCQNPFRYRLEMSLLLINLHGQIKESRVFSSTLTHLLNFPSHLLPKINLVTKPWSSSLFLRNDSTSRAWASGSLICSIMIALSILLYSMNSRSDSYDRFNPIRTRIIWFSTCLLWLVGPSCLIKGLVRASKLAILAAKPIMVIGSMVQCSILATVDSVSK